MELINWMYANKGLFLYRMAERDVPHYVRDDMFQELVIYIWQCSAIRGEITMDNIRVCSCIRLRQIITKYFRDRITSRGKTCMSLTLVDSFYESQLWRDSFLASYEFAELKERFLSSVRNKKVRKLITMYLDGYSKEELMQAFNLSLGDLHSKISYYRRKALTLTRCKHPNLKKDVVNYGKLSKQCGISRSTLLYRIRSGMSVEEATRKKPSLDKTPNRVLYKGEYYTYWELAKITGLNPRTLKHRIKKYGYSVEQAVEKRLNNRRNPLTTL